MAATDLFARRATLARSLRLLGEFRFEQRDPARFYGALAGDTAAMVSDLWRATDWHLAGRPDTARRRRRARLLRRRRSPTPACTTSASNPIRAKCTPGPAHGAAPAHFVRASGMALPFADASVDICLSSNVAEHVPQPWRLGREMLRVTKPGGLAVLSYTVWLGPFGGHETGLWHYLGGARAAARYARKHGHPAKNDYGSSLFAVSAADGLQWARQHRRADRRIPALPPTMGVVDDDGAGAEGVPGEQSWCWSCARPILKVKHVLVLRFFSVGWRHDAERWRRPTRPSTTSCSSAVNGRSRRPPRSSRCIRRPPASTSARCRWPPRPTSTPPARPRARRSTRDRGRQCLPRSAAR